MKKAKKETIKEETTENKNKNFLLDAKKIDLIAKNSDSIENEIVKGVGAEIVGGRVPDDFTESFFQTGFARSMG